MMMTKAAIAAGRRVSLQTIVEGAESQMWKAQVGYARKFLEEEGISLARFGRELGKPLNVNKSVPLPDVEGGMKPGKTQCGRHETPDHGISVWGSLGGPKFRGPRRLPMTVAPLLFVFPSCILQLRLTLSSPWLPARS
jgi:hypothetical protein